MNLVGDLTGGPVCRWIESQLHVDLGECAAIGVVQDEALIAAVAFNNYQPHMIEASVVATTPRWCSRRVLAAVFAYPFRQLGVRRVQATTARRNKRARKFIERLGFKYEGIARKGWPRGGDAAVYSMLNNECRWLRDG